jgi:transposase
MIKPQSDEQIPAETIRIARAAFPKGNRLLTFRDEFGKLYQDEDFSEFFSYTGQPALAPWRLALVTVFQFVENLSDRQAADAVRGRLDWKYALGLELADPGFDFSVLSEFRARLVEGQAEQLLLNKLLEQCRSKGLVKARGKQRTDSSHILAQIRTLNRSECIIETLRAALNVVATVEPEWLKGWVPKEWLEHYGLRAEETRLMQGTEARKAYLERVGNDGLELLTRVYHADSPGYLAKLEAIDILRRVWLHQFWIDNGQLRYREAKDLAPARLRVNSPYDVDAKYGNKRSLTWTGYKVFVTESCDGDSPHLITHVETTGASLSDVHQTEIAHRALEKKQLLPKEHLVDTGFIDAELIVKSQHDFGIELIGPVRRATSWQHQMPEAYDLSKFEIDWERQKVICPNGKTSSTWNSTKDSWGNAFIRVQFRHRDCSACQVRQLCTQKKADPRHLNIRPREHHEALVKARQAQETEEWKELYHQRAGIEGTFSQGVRTHNLRRSRYRGLPKTHLQHVVTATAINVQRLADWFADIPRAQTRTSRFAQLFA